MKAILLLFPLLLAPTLSLAETGKTESLKAEPVVPPAENKFRFPEEGIVIPEEMTQVKERLDANKDGRLTEEELAAAPEEIRAKILERLQQLSMGNGGEMPGGRSPMPPASPETPGESSEMPAGKKDSTDKEEEEEGPFVLPEGGIAIPEHMTQLKENLDKNEDGLLTEEELQAAPEAAQSRIRAFFKSQASTTPPTSPEPGMAADKPTDLPEIPAEGIAIPEFMVQVKERFDSDGDNRLSAEEFEKVPAQIRERLLSTLLGGQQPGSPAPDAPPKPPAEESPAPSTTTETPPQD